jgi:hypothetical protein
LLKKRSYYKSDDERRNKMLYKLSKRALPGFIVALLLMTAPVYAVGKFKISNYGAGSQIWFEAEDFDERDPDDESSFALSDQPGAFGRSINSANGNDGESMIRYTFDISKAGGAGGNWYFWGRVINPNNNSDFMLVAGHPGDQVPFTLPVSGLASSQRIFEQSDLGNDWVWAPTEGSAGEEAHTKTLQNGENTMYILNRESGAVWDVFMWTDDPDYVPTDEDYINATVPSLGATYDPNPVDGAEDVPRDVLLSWMPGEYASAINGHKIYFSEVLDDVKLGVGGLIQSAESFAPPQDLDFSTTYYWRVDEVDGSPENTVIEGNIWSFTTEPLAYAIENITATASSSNSADEGPEKTINGSGLNEDDLHSLDYVDMWLSSITGPQPTWIQYEFDRVYKLHQMSVWNHNSPFEQVFGLGIMDAAVEHSVDGINWTTLGTTYEFTKAPGAAGYAQNTMIDFEGIAAKYVKITANSNWGNLVTQYGLSEVRFMYIPVQARESNPVSGSTDIDVDNTTLLWRAGREAAEHNVYFSADEQEVIDETISPVSVPVDGSYAAYDTGPLDLNRIYYWKVNEVNETEDFNTWYGDVWSFTTQEFLVVDDFESYNDLNEDQPDSNRIYLAWLDGFDNPAINGSVVGYANPPFAEQIIVHSGYQSMPMSYDNAVGKSEATYVFTPSSDWTVKGVDTLTIWYIGDAANAAETMYVVLNSSAGVDNDIPDAAQATAWTEWNIPLQTFTDQGVNLANVNSITLGLGNRNNPIAGGSGMMYFDDIRLYAPAP